MEKPPVVPTNTELHQEIQKLWDKITKLSFDMECLKTENETFRRQLNNRH